MFIKEISIRNYMIHKDTRVTLSPLAVFVGPNGGGKSALFDAILNFKMLATGRIKEAFGLYSNPFRAFLYSGANPNTSRIGFKVEMSKSEDSSESLIYEIDYSQMKLTQSNTPQFIIHNEKLWKQPSGKLIFDRAHSEDFPISKKLSHSEDQSLLSALRQKIFNKEVLKEDELTLYCTQQIGRFNKFRLNPIKLSKASPIPDLFDSRSPGAVPRIDYEGENLAASLYYLHNEKASELDEIKTKIKEVDESFSDFEFNNVGPDRIAFSVVYADDRRTVPASRLSSGILSFIGLTNLVLSPNRPNLLMIEEPENGLTPKAIRSFYGAVHDLAFPKKNRIRSQVLISSHSPFVICEAWNGDDRDFIHQVKVEEGKSVIRKYSEAVEQSYMLSKDKGKRDHLSLKTADVVMSGY